MKIPEFIKIGGHTITVRLVFPSDITNSGSYSSYYNLIRLESDYDTPEDSLAETFLHEIIEGIKNLNNLKVEHTELSVISESLFAVIRNNNLDVRIPEIKK